MIYMVYAPIERPLAHRVANELKKYGNFEFKFSPVGIPAMGEEWKRQVDRDMRECDSAIILRTNVAASDDSVKARLHLCFHLQLPIFPIAFTKNVDELKGMFELNAIMHFLFDSDDAFHQNEVQHMADYLSKYEEPASNPRKVLCFLSYSRKDTDFAIKLAADLREAKLKTWRDAENIPAGANWDREIEKAIKECTHLILIASPSSVESENVMDEVSLAINKEKTVIPVMIETCDLPMRVHRAQWVDFRDGYEQGLKKLLEQLGVKKSE